MTLLSLWLASSTGSSEALPKKRRPAEYGGGGDLAGLDEREWAADARGLMRSVTHCRASQTCASMHWRQCAQMRVELRCESLDPAELKRFPTRSG